MAAQKLSLPSRHGNPLDFADLPVTVTAVGLILPDDLKFEDWRDAGKVLGRVTNSMQWLIGDWWRHGWHRYGSRVQLVESLGLSFQACEDCGWVCGKFETSRRREALTFSHHREVAGIDPAMADELLDWCIRGGTACHSTRELREEARRRQAEKFRALVRSGETRSFPTQDVKLVAVVKPISLDPPYRNPPSKLGPAFELDTTAAGGPVDPQLEALSDLPPTKVRRVEIARAALADLTVDDLSDSQALQDAIIALCRRLPPTARAHISMALQ